MIPPTHQMVASRAFALQAAKEVVRMCRCGTDPPAASLPHHGHPSAAPFRTRGLNAGCCALPTLFARLCGSGYPREVVCALFVLLHRFVAATDTPLSLDVVERLVPAALQIAAKSVSDFYRATSRVARLWELESGELAQLEAAFLTAIDWDVVVTKDELLQAGQRITDAAHTGGRGGTGTTAAAA
eukprot:Rhum_TRINITY_DN16017_c0_g1::Rhum_TRINITY_DN16017_c0_g1_i1::g.162645::m.162645